MKVRILSTGNVEEYDESYALRLVDMGYAVPVKAGEAKAKKPVTVEVVDKVPETEAAAEETPKAEEPAETRPAKGKKSK